MLRDELLQRLLALPAGADVVLRIGGGHIDIAEVVFDEREPSAGLMPHLPDLRDVLREHGMPATGSLVDPVPS